MEILEVKPNEGIGQIKLGMEREKVYNVLGKSGHSDTTMEWIDYYHIEYRGNKVAFVEIPNSVVDTHFVLFNGVDVFRTEAKLLVRFISEYGKYDESDWELGYSYKFPSLGMGLWRPSIFEYETIYDSSFKEMNKEIQFDEMKYLYFEAVCVYTKDYYEKKGD
jgi:hypothetical protein